MQIRKILILCLLGIMTTSVFARKPIKKKPFNAYYLFSEFHQFSYYTGEVSFGLGKFKTKCKGYEMSSTVRLYRTEEYHIAPPFRIGFTANKFHRKTVGRHSSSVGYRLGLSYTQERERRGPVTYTEGPYEYSLNNAYYVSNLYAINSEVFWNKRLFGRVYFEMKFGVKNGIENIQFTDSEIVSKSLNFPQYPHWRNKGPGTYLSTKANISARLLFCFGKAKK